MIGRIVLGLLGVLALASSVYSFRDVVILASSPAMSPAEALAANLNLLLSLLLLTVCMGAALMLEQLHAIRRKTDKADVHLSAMGRLLQAAEDRARK